MNDCPEIEKILIKNIDGVSEYLKVHMVSFTEELIVLKLYYTDTSKKNNQGLLN